MNISIKRVDHWGIVGGMIQDLGLVELVNNAVGVNKQEILTTGDVVGGLVINGLGFACRPLMLAPQFFENKALDLLIKPGITAEHFNRHRIGRALDALSEYGCEKLFNSIALSACAKEGVETRFAHADTTSYSLQGDYATEETDENGQPLEQKITITYGYSKAHRPDLKQVIQELVTSEDGGIPFITKTLSGNASDVQILRERAKSLMAEFATSTNRCLVADSKLYTEGTADTLNRINFITRVPGTLKREQEVIMDAIDKATQWTELANGYKYQESSISVYGIENQRWIVFYSQEAHKRSIKALTKEVEKEKTTAEKQLSTLENKPFKCRADAVKAFTALSKKWRYHTLSEPTIVESKSYASKGRPSSDTPYEMVYRVSGSAIYSKSNYLKVLDKHSCFVLATNMPSESLSSDAVLAVYKGQDYTEKGFAFLKKPEFFTSSLNLEKPGRIEAVLMIMVLSLLVYSLAQRRLRKALLSANLLIPNQLKKPIANPTMRWIFQLFEGVNFVEIDSDSIQKTFIEGLNDVRKLVASLLGGNVLKIYLRS